MAPDADATAGASQGWHDLEAVLAEEPAATLLAAYLARSGRRFGVVLIGAGSLEAGVGHLAALTGGELLVAGDDAREAVRLAFAALRRRPPGLGPLAERPAELQTVL